MWPLYFRRRRGFRQVRGLSAGQGVLVVQRVMLETSCLAWLPRAGRSGASELLGTLWPLSQLLPPGWHGMMERLPGEGWGQMGMDLPWATHPGLTTVTTQCCQAQRWSELSASPWGLVVCQNRFHWGNVRPTGLSTEQLPLLPTGWGCQEDGRKVPESPLRHRAACRCCTGLPRDRQR